MKQENLHLIFAVLMAIAIIALIVSIILLVKYKDVIMADPMKYGMEQRNFDSCTCKTSEGQYYEITREGYKKINNLNFNIKGK